MKEIKTYESLAVSNVEMMISPKAEQHAIEEFTTNINSDLLSSQNSHANIIKTDTRPLKANRPKSGHVASSRRAFQALNDKQHKMYIKEQI